MNWLKTIGREVLGLFIDDGRFAATIVVWLGLAFVLTRTIFANSHWSGIVLLAGLLAILIESAMRRARH